MLLKRSPRLFVLTLAALALVGLAASPAAAGPDAPTCNAKIDYEVAPEAEIVSLDCVCKNFDGQPSTYFDIKIKNISTEEQRFRVNIFLPDGKGVGGLLPRKTAKGLVKPGETAGGSYPAKGVATKPASLEIYVSTMAK